MESWGQCTDFNLMLRKGKCQGMVQALSLSPGSYILWSAPVPAPQAYPRTALALYCVSGELVLPEEQMRARAGELLLCGCLDGGALRLESEKGAKILISTIYSQIE